MFDSTSAGGAGLKFIDEAQLDYSKIGEKYLQDLREQVRKRENDVDLAFTKNTENSGANTDQKSLKAEDIMEMTPAQKNEFLSRRKLQQKKEAEVDAAKKDAKTLIIERK